MNNSKLQITAKETIQRIPELLYIETQSLKFFKNPDVFNINMRFENMRTQEEGVGRLFLYVDMFTFLCIRSAYIWIYIPSVLKKNMIQITYHDLIKSYYTIITLSS